MNAVPAPAPSAPPATSPADPLRIGTRTFSSRLLIGTGKYRDFDETRRAVDESGAQIVTVAIRRTNIGQDANAPSLLDGHTLVKLEVLGDPQNLYPNMPETVKAAEVLVKDGFEVMVYCSDDPIQARVLESVGCVAVMPLASLIGSGMGILNPWNLQLILEKATVPVIVDAGVGTASDAAIAMELGCAGVLMNTAVAAARDPVRMARAMRLAVEAGRDAFLAGRMPRKLYGASPSSPTGGMIAPSKAG
jgi:thiazole synthase